jgi:hypothetical protein
MTVICSFGGKPIIVQFSQIIEALAKPLEEEEVYIDSGMKLAQENRAHCTFDEVHAFNRCAWLCQ